MRKIAHFLIQPLVLIFLVLIIDQSIKIWIKTHLYLGEEIPVFGDWFIIHFTENNGMAFGLELGTEYGKLILSLFRMLAVGAIGWILFTFPRDQVSKGLLACVALIFAGAVGNIIDSVFYGVIFNDSYAQLATMFPPEGGYASLLHGRVVDMLYFPIIKGFVPDWVPIWGGEYFVFFRPVFNIADSAITVGVISIILFHRDFFKNGFSLPSKSKNSEVQETSET